jgi:hypothetical protein
VEWHLCALGERAEQDQHQRRQVKRALADVVARGEDRIDVVTSRDVREHQHAGQQAQSARDGDDQRRARGIARRLAVVPVADQEEREQAGQFPEEHKLDHVPRQHDAQHRAHEAQQQREEPDQRVLARHVIGRVDSDQESNAAHQDQEQPGESVHAQREIQAKARRPRESEAKHVAVGNGREQQRRKDQADSRGAGHQPGRPPAVAAADQRGDQRGCKRQQQDCG